MIIIYDGKDACKKCLGWKRVDDGEGISWKYWAELPAHSALAISLGIVKPIECPRCKGTGIEPKEEKEN
jgi:DnaJ-class molecular chaperone